MAPAIFLRLIGCYMPYPIGHCHSQSVYHRILPRGNYRAVSLTNLFESESLLIVARTGSKRSLLGRSQRKPVLLNCARNSIWPLSTALLPRESCVRAIPGIAVAMIFLKAAGFLAQCYRRQAFMPDEYAVTQSPDGRLVPCCRSEANNSGREARTIGASLPHPRRDWRRVST